MTEKEDSFAIILFAIHAFVYCDRVVSFEAKIRGGGGGIFSVGTESIQRMSTSKCLY